MNQRYEQWYQRISNGLRKQPVFVQIIRMVNKGLTYLFYLIYPALLIWLAYQKDPRLLLCILIPGTSFCVVSALRILIGRPRPYITNNIEPLIVKSDTKKSMPSRHVFSSTMIAMTVGCIFPALLAPLLALCLIIATVRILGGIHYPSDVAMGLLIGLLCGALLMTLT